MVGGGLVPFSLTSGRMRYAPTLVRLLSWPNTINHYPRSVIVGMGWMTNLLGGLQWDDECTNALGP